jgi:hypothetical protein
MAGIVFVSTVGGVVAVAVAVVVAVRLLGLLWFAFADGVERASTTLRSILDQTVVGIPLSSSNSLAMVSCSERLDGGKRRSRTETALSTLCCRRVGRLWSGSQREGPVGVCCAGTRRG